MDFPIRRSVNIIFYLLKPLRIIAIIVVMDRLKRNKAFSTLRFFCFNAINEKQALIKHHVPTDIHEVTPVC